eukprot:403374270
MRTMFMWALIVPFCLMGFDYYMSRFNEYKPTELGVTQQQMQQRQPQSEKLKLIDEDKGTMLLNGWGVDMDKDIFVNHQHAAPLSLSIPQLNALKYRTWDYFLIHTPTHVIQFNLVDISLGVVCPTSSLIVFEKENLSKTLKRAEVNFDCPKYKRDSLALGEKVELASKAMNITIALKTGSTREYEITLVSKNPDLKMNLEFDYQENQGGIWATPLSNDLRNFFATQKRPVSVKGAYNLNGKEFKCQGTHCQMMIDIGRGSFNYGTAYFWVLIMTTLPDGRTLTLNLGDGIGSEYKTLQKATEDFAILNGKFYKLDVTEMDYYKDDYFTKKTIRTAQSTQHGSKVFPNRGCNLNFEPADKMKEGLNIGVLAVVQHFSYGYFSGECIIEGETINLNRVYGHVEQVFSRW